jgi:hypothetical protein
MSVHRQETGRAARRYDRSVLARSLPVLTSSLCCTALATGCSSTTAPPSPTCSESPQAVEAALTRAPGAVRLRDGTRLSQCISHAVDEGPLQNVGATFVAAASDLAARARTDRVAALRLGYLVGATQRGAATTNGVALELARRLERAGALSGAPAASLAAEQVGLAAGQRRG